MTPADVAVGRSGDGRRGLLLRGAVVAVLLLSGCTAGATPPAAGERGDAAVVPALDGEFISRRAAAALELADDVAREPLEQSLLDAAAGLEHDPRLAYAAVLRSTRPGSLPQVTVLLEEGTTTDDAQHVLDALGAADGVVARHAVTVYAHDIVLTAPVDDALESADALSLEGILADALGFHEVEVAPGQLTVRYVGPLLSRSQLDSAVTALVRAGAGAPASVRLSPGTPGSPVDWAEVDDPFADVRRLDGRPHGHG